ncbi:MAG: glycosyltransferase family 39 protein [Planctomycetota bacterium]|mgnify:CR=1 FL=1
MQQNSEQNSKWILPLILCIGGVVRLWGIHFGLPHTDCRPDETTLIQIALGFFQGDWNPHFFNYPSFYPYSLFVLYSGYFQLRDWGGASPEDLLFEITWTPTNLYLISRLFSATAGILTLWILFRLARLLENQKVAWVSAFYLSFCYLHVRDSHFGTTDILMTFWSYCALYQLLQYQQKPSFRLLFWSSFFTGIALSTKYGAVFLFLSMVAIVATQRDRSFRLKGKDLSLYLLLSLFFFLVGTPYALFDWNQFSSDFLDEMQHLSEGHHQIILGKGFGYHLRYSLPYGMTWTLFLLSLVGIVIHFRTSFRKAFVFYLFPCCVYLSAGKGYTVFIRYMIPLLPALCLSAGIATVALSNCFQLRFPRLLPILACLFLSPSITQVILLDKILSQPDNRVICADWIDQNIPESQSIYQPNFFISQKNQFSRSSFKQNYVNVNIHAQVQNLPTPWEDSLRVRQILPDYILMQQSPVLQSNSCPEWVTLFLKKQYRLIRSFEVVDIKNSELWYDQQDAFYLPLLGLSQITRSGPNFYLYQKKK